MCGYMHICDSMYMHTYIFLVVCSKDLEVNTPQNYETYSIQILVSKTISTNGNFDSLEEWLLPQRGEGTQKKTRASSYA